MSAAYDFDKAQRDMLEEVSGIRAEPDGAYNIRVNGQRACYQSTDNVSIESKANGRGIEVRVKAGTKGEFVHIPVVITQTGVTERVENDFYIGAGADVTIVAGCGIDNCGCEDSQHDGIHTFRLEENSRVFYAERHVGEGDGTGGRILNPITDVYLAPGSYMEMETTQIRGVDSTRRVTRGAVGDGATLIVREKIMTHGRQRAVTEFNVELDGRGSSSHLVSRSVARDDSYQEFLSVVNGNNECMGHSECDAIIMDRGVVRAAPEVTAHHVDASLIHEAAIGKIAGEQIVKLMTLGLTREEAEEQIVNGFLR